MLGGTEAAKGGRKEGRSLGAEAYKEEGVLPSTIAPKARSEHHCCSLLCLESGRTGLSSYLATLRFNMATSKESMKQETSNVCCCCSVGVFFCCLFVFDTCHTINKKSIMVNQKKKKNNSIKRIGLEHASVCKLLASCEHGDMSSSLAPT